MNTLQTTPQPTRLEALTPAAEPTAPRLNRRALLASLPLLAPAVAAASTTAATTGATAPVAPPLTFVYESVVRLAPDVPHGHTPHGERIRAPILGGEFHGAELSGRVVPGGADWQLLRTDGWFELDAEYFIETTDGVQIRIRNHGLWHSPTGDWPADYAVTLPEFEAPDGRYGWLNHSVFIGTVGPGPDASPAVTIRVWRVG